jgi:hypothetical protein
MGSTKTRLICSFAVVSLSVNCSDPTGSEPTLGIGGALATAGSTGASGSGGGGTSAATGGAATSIGGSVAGAGAGAAEASGGSMSGGAAGSSGGGTPGGAPSRGGDGGTSVTCPTGVPFCDDFESYADMTAPNGKWKTWTVGKGKLVVDSAHAFSGTQAAHFHGKVAQSGAAKEQAFMLAEGAPAFPVAGKTAFLRFMLYGTRFPFTGVTTANHSVFAWIGSTKALNNPDRGATNEGYMFADYNGVAIEPMWSGYFRDTTRHLKDANQANNWHCWEVEIDNAGGPPPGAAGVALPHIWEDSVELKLNRAGSGDTYAAISFEAILFSLWSPQADNADADYWVDDVAFSPSRINCPEAK